MRGVRIMQILLDLPTTPEDLYLIIKDFSEKFTKTNTIYLYDDLWVEVIPEKKRKVIQLEDGSKTEVEIEISPARPENLVINFCDRPIISIQGKQTSHYPSNLRTIINLLVSENDYEINRYIDINGKEVYTLDGYDQAKFIFNKLINWLDGYFPEKQGLMTKSVGVHNVNKIAPNRLGDLNKWKAAWQHITRKNWLNMGMSPATIHEFLDKDHTRKEYHGTVFSVETIGRIITAGRAGELS
jgi:hypothetical protein